ncbi:hypothetical protein GCM10023094_47370 [Rhodococcus olei]|uniref:Uncharacterized protein n=2 Tax=Rhodococcus olei TaxID=2161675 RepID=A0ABP8PL16_9NOCA
MKQTLLATSIAAAGILLAPGAAYASTAYTHGAAPSATATTASATYEGGVDQTVQNVGCDPQFSSENEPGDCCNDQQWRDLHESYCAQFDLNDIPGLPPFSD